MSETGFNQLDYSQELGTGTGATIHDYGCAECSVTSECVNAGHATNPVQLNQDLIRVNAYASNGAGANDELIFSKVSDVYSDMQLAFNDFYPSNPADMGKIDAQLSKGVGVIVGVDFNHNPSASSASHFVRIYKKNTDGSYQCFDSWAVNGITDVNFNNRWAVNGMSAAQAILQAVSYNYTPANGVNGTMYKGLDLTNQDSMKVAVDVWAELQAGTLIAKSVYDQKVQADQTALDTANSALSKAQTDVQAYESVCALLQLTKDSNGNNPLFQEVQQAISDLKKLAADRLQALTTANDKITKLADAMKIDPAGDYDLGSEVIGIEKERDAAVLAYTAAKEEIGLPANAGDKDVINAIDELKKPEVAQPTITTPPVTPEQASGFLTSLLTTIKSFFK